MRTFTTIAGLRCYLELLRSKPQQVVDQGAVFSSAGSARIGLVPTMGALHAGHLSLIQRARRETDRVVVSIFVNPLQFAPNEDFQRYPRTFESDRQLCAQEGVDVIFAPSVDELYGANGYGAVPDRVTRVIPPTAMMAGLCGHSRPNHFQGVATVVSKLFNIVQPDRAYFGQKDAQQVAILRQMVTDLNVPVELISCPIVREADGLAMSSRNRYLSADNRQQATVVYRSLRQAEQAFYQGKTMRDDLVKMVETELATAPAVKPEYIELVNPETLAPLEQIEEAGLLAVAVHLGTTRLIDNVLLRNRQPILAIDGPAGAGKSTVVRQVAHRLNLLHLDTGAMYRAVTWLVLTSGIAIDDEAAIAELVSQCDIVLESEPNACDQLSVPCVWINGQDVTQVIRGQDVTAQVSAIAAQPIVRQELVRRQQVLGRRGGIVAEGRDIGTHVFPDAELKIFLTASVQERARRRQQDLKHQGQLVSLEDLERSIYERDRKDSTRRFAPLKKAADAIEIQSDCLSIDEVTDKIVELYRQTLATLSRHSV